MIDGATVRIGAGSFDAVRKRARGAVEERFALGAMAVTIALLPLLTPRGPGNTAPIDVLLVGSLSVCLLWAGTSGRRWRFPYVVPMALVLLGGVLGALAGSLPGRGLLAVAQDAVLLAWAWALANLAAAAALNLRALAVAWVYSAIAWAGLLFIGLALGSLALTGQTEREASRTALTFGDPNVSANYYFVSMMLIWATGHPRPRLVRLIAYALLLSALVSTGSNSGLLSLLVGVTIGGVLAVYRRAGTAPAVAALTVALVGGYLATANISLSSIEERAADSRYAFLRDGIGRGETSVSQRDTLLRESVALYRSGGALGQGPGSTKPRLDAENAPLVKEAHDDYVAALLERGAVGLVGVLLLVAGVGFRSIAACAPPLAGRLAAGIARPNALVGAVAGTVVVSAAYELLHIRHVWALFALVAAAYAVAREQASADRSGTAAP